MAKQVESRENFAVDIIQTAKRKIWWCRVALIISIVGNIILAAILISR